MELLEREQSLAELRDWLASVAGQGGCIALVGREAGLGKAALLQRFAGGAARVPRAVGDLRCAVYAPTARAAA